MGVLIVEFVTGGGEFLLGDSAGFSAALVAEGQAMRDAVAAMLRSVGEEPVAVFQAQTAPACLVPGVTPLLIKDEADFWDQLEQKCAAGPWATGGWGVIVIAPETHGWLGRLTRYVEQSTASLLCPDSSFVDLCADKTLTVDWLASRDVPVPQTRCHARAGWIAKPRFGCGSEDVRVLPSSTRPSPADYPREQWHVEPRVEGLPVSITCLRTAGGFTLLPPYEQCFTSVSPWIYAGGRLLRNQDLSRRCQRLARQSIQALPCTQGVFGLDLLLGPESAADVVLEVNPRFTTSWVGLCRGMGRPLGLAWSAMQRGRLMPIRQSDLSCEADAWAFKIGDTAPSPGLSSERA